MENIELKKVLFVKDIDTDTYTVKTIGTKEIYAPNGNSASKWVREENKGRKTEDSPQMTNAIGIKQKGRGRLVKNALSYLTIGGNSVNDNLIGVYITSVAGSRGNGLSVIPENYKKIVALFSARKSIAPNWINSKDEYLTPNTEHPDYEQWNNDAIIYSLFNNSSQQSSLRDITYKDKKWDIVNNFFFMSNSEMRELANSNNYPEMYQDTKAFDKDRYVYNLLQETVLSLDAQKILNMAKELIKKSFEEREDYNDEHPEQQMQCWDAGWAQLKPLLKERFKEEYAEFVEAYKEFENRMRKGVYKFGFLKE